MFGVNISLLGWALLLVVVALVSYIYMTWPYDYFEKRGIPGPKPLAFWGNMNEMGTKPFWIQDMEWVEKYGKVFGMFFFGRKFLMVSDKEMLKEIFVKDFDSFSGKTKFENRGILKYGILDVTGQHWKDQQNQLSPYFSVGTMKMSMESINKIMDNLVNWLDEKCDKGEMVEARDFAEMMAMDVICSTAFGAEVNSCQYPDTELLRKFREMMSSFRTGNMLLMLTFMCPTFGKLLDLLCVESTDLSYCEQFTRHLIEQRRDQDEKAGHDFVNILLKERRGSGKGMPDDEIIGNAVLFLMAGYDTTAGSLSFLLYNLVVYPECQEKVFQEIQEILGDQPPSYENVQQLHYLEMCLDESLRLFPPFPRLDRLCVKDTVVKGVTFDKGISVGMPIWKLHRDPEVWEDPDTFDPQRFTPEKKKARDPFSYLPFGIGPRHCIGMRLALLELKIAAVKICQKFKLTRSEKTKVPLELDPKSMFMRSKDGIWLSLEKRN